MDLKKTCYLISWNVNLVSASYWSNPEMSDLASGGQLSGNVYYVVYILINSVFLLVSWNGGYPNNIS